MHPIQDTRQTISLLEEVSLSADVDSNTSPAHALSAHGSSFQSVNTTMPSVDKSKPRTPIVTPVGQSIQDPEEDEEIEVIILLSQQEASLLANLAAAGRNA